MYNKKNWLKILTLVFVIFTLIPIVSGSAIYSVSLSVPNFANTNSSVTVSASTRASAEYIYIYVNGVKVQSCYSTASCSYTFSTSGSISKYTITASAFQYASTTNYIRLRFPVPSGSDSVFGIAYSTWYSNARDFARSPDSATLWERAYKILSMINQGSGLQNPSNAISAINTYAQSYLLPYYASDIDSLTAEQSANYIDANTLIPSRTFECSDLAAYLSGLGEVLGIPSRMTSVTVYYGYPYPGYQHMFAELYGKSAQSDNGVSNNGWFLIDPGHPNSVFYISFTDTNTVKASYSYISHAYRFWIIWGSTSANWGSSISDYSRATNWVIFQWVGGLENFIYYSTSSHMVYSPNPWSIISDYSN